MAGHQPEPTEDDDDDDDDFSDLPEGGPSLLKRREWTPAQRKVVDRAVEQLDEREREREAKKSGE